MTKVGTSRNHSQDHLSALREDFPKWNIDLTPEKYWVAKRKRYFNETLERIDKGFRFALIQRTEADLREAIRKQEKLHERYPEVPL